MRIVLIPFADVQREVLERIKRSVSSAFKQEVEIHPKEHKIPDCEVRGEQLDADGFIPVIQDIAKRENADFGLGVVDHDLYSGNLNFVFGIAYLNSSVISLARLKSENRELFLKRAVKEAVHEIGHLFGLGHCPNPKCVMHFSNCLADTDIKSERFCKECEGELNV